MRVRHPAGVYGIILARGNAVYLVFPCPEGDIGARSAVHVNGLCFLQEPDAHFKAEILGSKGSYRAEVHGVHGVVAVQLAAGVNRDGVEGAALGHGEHLIVHDVAHEAHAAAAEHAAFLVQVHARANAQVFSFFGLFLFKTAFHLAVVVGVFLKLAFPGLVADGAVQRVAGEQEFHYAAARFTGQGAVRADAHVFRHRVCAGDDGAGHPLDALIAVFIIGGCLSRSEPGRHPLFHHAHAAGAGDSQLGVVAEARNGHAHGTAGVCNPRAAREPVPRSVDLDVHLAFRGGNVFGEFGSFFTHDDGWEGNGIEKWCCVLLLAGEETGLFPAFPGMGQAGVERVRQGHEFLLELGDHGLGGP